MHDVHVASLKRALKGVPSKNPRDAHDAKDTLPLGSLHVHLPISASSCQYLSDKLLVAFHSSFQEKNNTFTHTHTQRATKHLCGPIAKTHNLSFQCRLWIFDFQLELAS